MEIGVVDCTEYLNHNVTTAYLVGTTAATTAVVGGNKGKSGNNRNESNP